ncbi:MAG TPA: hypothetical protein GXZ66_06250 [Clostridiaceae bacterium]|nr:hypothetical protein [Clostridiaceae bacterium]
MSRKTKKVITVLVPLVLLVVILGVYELKVKRYGMSQYVLYIDGNRFMPMTPEWKYNELSERIGYVKEDNYLPSMFYAPFKHGIYSLKDDPENLFYQPKKVFASKDYVLFARDDIVLSMPNITDVQYMEYEDGKGFFDEKIIEEFFELLYTPSNSVVKTEFTIHYMKVFVKGYKCIHYRITICEDRQSRWYIEKNQGGYFVHVRIPDELAERLFGPGAEYQHLFKYCPNTLEPV